MRKVQRNAGAQNTGSAPGDRLGVPLFKEMAVLLSPGWGETRPLRRPLPDRETRRLGLSRDGASLSFFYCKGMPAVKGYCLLGSGSAQRESKKV